jgi:hypothetical protein
MSGTLTSIYPTLFDVTWLKSGTNISYTGGNVGIGTNTPTAKLEIVGFLKVTELGDYTSINIGKDTNDRIFADNTVAKSYG